MTQRSSRAVCELTENGNTLFDRIEFESRRGDELKLWAVFERPEDRDSSPQLHIPTHDYIRHDDSELVEVMTMLHLVWEH